MLLENQLPSDTKPILGETGAKLLPPELYGKTPRQLESAWPEWVKREDAKIRARVERGNEDSIINLLRFGVTFTALPRITNHDTASREIIRGRIKDMIGAIATSASDERLRFARSVVQCKGIDPSTTQGKNDLERYLSDGLERSLADTEGYFRVRQPADALTLFRDRGLSSDTSVLPDFGIEQALAALNSDGLLDVGTIHRVAIVGPGLDFADRREGYDFYPQQTIQPFAVIDSLIRQGLASPDLQMTTFDLSARVNEHLETARQRARGNDAYVLQLPRQAGWTPQLVAYWARLGDRVGEEAKPVSTPPALAGTIQVRAVRIRPAVVGSIVPQDLNIVLQRLEPLADNERFDLVVATNVLLYYDIFEQWLALTNVAKMLRPGGLLLSNNAVFELSATSLKGVGYTDVVCYTDRQRPSDRLFWYQRR
jgi:hypothetical protein